MDQTRGAKTGQLCITVPTKGLRFLRGVPTSESPKGMGLMGIHGLDALWHYVGYTYCPWCGKEEQNERDGGQPSEDNPLQSRSCV